MSPGTRSQTSSQVSSEVVAEPSNDGPTTVFTCNELHDIIMEQSTIIDSLKGRLSGLETKMATIDSQYCRKIEDLELKLSTAAKSSAEANLMAVTGFYNQIDSKVEKLIIQQDITKVQSQVNMRPN